MSTESVKLWEELAPYFRSGNDVSVPRNAVPSATAERRF